MMIDDITRQQIIEKKKKVGALILEGDKQQEIVEIMQSFSEKELAIWLEVKVPSTKKEDEFINLNLAEEIVTPLVRQKLQGSIRRGLVSGHSAWDLPS